MQLEQLARRQSDVLANKLAMDGSSREIPLRPLPYGSEGVVSPTYVAQSPSTGTLGVYPNLLRGRRLNSRVTKDQERCGRRMKRFR